MLSKNKSVSIANEIITGNPDEHLIENKNIFCLSSLVFIWGPAGAFIFVCRQYVVFSILPVSSKGAQNYHLCMLYVIQHRVQSSSGSIDN